MRQWAWLAPVFAQHAGAGVVTALIVRGEYVGVFAAAVVMQGLWWVNMGRRIEARDGLTAWLYCGVSAAGVAVGAWVWR